MGRFEIGGSRALNLSEASEALESSEKGTIKWIYPFFGEIQSIVP